jgi:hypothetical protein
MPRHLRQGVARIVCRQFILKIFGIQEQLIRLDRFGPFP